jgi:2'-hydroxyisoflavone reductase
MKILILGGTIFLGRHLVDAALARGDSVSIFTRGKHGPDLFPQVERLRGDRDGNLGALEGRAWDVAIDTCGYVPRVVRASTRLLASSVAHYTFVSSISVYPDTRTEGIDEGAPVGTLADPTVETVDGETYGPLKALCEVAAEQEMPGRVLNVRPGLIVGPHDPSDRFTYWVERLAGGGDVLAPGRPERPVQVIDARDLAAWILEMASRRATGIYNATGPDRPLTLGSVLDSARRISGSDARPVWVTQAFLEAHGVEPWSEMPVWVPEDGDSAGIFSIDCRKAFAAGLTFRAIDETVADTLEWARSLPADRKPRAGIPREREAELLAAWRMEETH